MQTLTFYLWIEARISEMESSFWWADQRVWFH